MSDDYSRLDSQIDSIAALWLPRNPDTLVTGTLTANTDGNHFLTSPVYRRGSNVAPPDLSGTPQESSPFHRSEVLHGFFDGGIYSLLDTRAVQSPEVTDFRGEPQSIRSTRYRATAMAVGLHTGGLEDDSIDRARYTFSSLAEWLSVPRIESWDADEITIRVPFMPTTLLNFSVLANRSCVEVRLHYAVRTSTEKKSRVVEPIAIVEVTPEKAASIAWCLDYGARLENIFSLLTGASLALETMFITSGEKSGSIVQKRLTKVSSFDFRDALAISPSELAHALSVWVSESRGFRSIENLLLGVVRKSDLFVETQFLSLAQALEGLHQALQDDTEPLGRGPSFRDRLTQLCSCLSFSVLEAMGIDTVPFVGNVLRERNSLTHTGEPKSGESGPDYLADIFLLCQKMRALLRGAIFLHLGLSEDRIRDVVIRDATKWKIEE